jgi:DNA polymerase III epsilon subunit-like protein
MNDCMIDLETLSTRSNASILTIGAIKFDRRGDIRATFPGGPQSADDIIEKLGGFYARVNAETGKLLGLSADPATIKWWNNQKPEAKFEAMDAHPRSPIMQVLDEFYLWFGSTRNAWSHGAGFDCSIMEEAYKLANKKAPWHFAESRDTRTLFDLANFTLADQKATRSASHHHALFDAYDQIVMAQECFRRLANG